jgi:hypothetical protein
MSFLQNIRDAVFAPPHPGRLIYQQRLRLFAAAAAAVAATIVFVLCYYGTLGLLPITSTGEHDFHPIRMWNYRFDLSQFLGPIFSPPYPTKLTWVIGFAALCGLLSGAGVVFALLMSWAMQRSNAALGAGFGAALFLVLGFLIWLAPGYNPAVMRNSVPDVGFFLFGWSGWATLQLLACLTLYGASLGAAYSRLAR